MNMAKLHEALEEPLEAATHYQLAAQIYSVNSPDAIADGDELGRGTGIFLDVYNPTAGTSTDVAERKNEIKINS